MFFCKCEKQRSGSAVLPCRLISTFSQGATKDDFSGQFFRIFEIIIFCCVVAICDLVHDVETIFHLP